MSGNDYVKVTVMSKGDYRTVNTLNVEKGITFKGGFYKSSDSQYSILDDGSLVKYNYKTNIWEKVENNRIELSSGDVWPMLEISKYNDEKKFGDELTLSKKDIEKAYADFKKNGSTKRLEYGTGAFRYRTRGESNEEMISWERRFRGEKHSSSVVALDSSKESTKSAGLESAQSLSYQQMSVEEIAQDLWNEIKGLKSNNDVILAKVASLPANKSAEVMKYYKEVIRQGKAGLFEDMSNEWRMDIQAIDNLIHYFNTINH